MKQGSFITSCKWVGLILINIVALYIVNKSVNNVFYSIEPNTCTMTYMLPTYYSLPMNHTRYQLFLYREIKSVTPSNNHHPASIARPFTQFDRPLRGIPVLFVPGNSGSYKQIRSIGSEAYNQIQQQLLNSANSIGGGSTLGQKIVNPNNKNGIRKDYEYLNGLDIFTVDFEEELSALGGDVMYKETAFVNDCIKHILELYETQKLTPPPDFVKPTSVILIGHSMGGVVSRMTALLPNHKYGSVNTIITLQSAHRNAPIYSHQTHANFYHELNRHWSQSIQPKHFEFNDKGEPTNLPPIYDNICIISIGGGHRDTLIRSETTSLEGIVSKDKSLSVITTSMPGVQMEICHQSILWCNEVVLSLVEALLLLGHPTTKQNTFNVYERIDIFKSVFKDYVPNHLEITAKQSSSNSNSDYMHYLSRMKESLRSELPLVDVVKQIPFETKPIVTIVNKASVVYKDRGNGLRISNSNSELQTYYIHFKVQDFIRENANTLQFSFSTSLGLNGFKVLLYYNDQFEAGQDVSFKSFVFPPLAPFMKSNIEPLASQLVLLPQDLENVYSLLIAFPKSVRKQKFIAVAKFYDNIESNINIDSIGLFDDRKYIVKAGHSSILNFTLPFYYNKYYIKATIKSVTPDGERDNQDPIFLPFSYQYIPGFMEEGKFVVNATTTRIRFHQSSKPSKLYSYPQLQQHHHQQRQPHSDLKTQSDVNPLIVVETEQSEGNSNLESKQPQSNNNNNNNNNNNEEETNDYSSIPNVVAADGLLPAHETFIDHPHILMVLDPSLSYEIKFSYDFFGSIGALIFTHSTSIYATTYSLFLWVFSSQLNSWRNKDVMPHLLTALRDETILLSPFFIVIPIIISMTFGLFGNSSPNLFDRKILFPDPFIDQFMLEHVPPFWSIPLFFIASVTLLTLLVLLFSIILYLIKMIPKPNSTSIGGSNTSNNASTNTQSAVNNILQRSFYIGNYQLSFPKWIFVGGLLILVIHSLMGLLFFLLFLLISPNISNNNVISNSTSSLTLLKKKNKPPSQSQIDHQLYYQQSIFIMYLFAGFIMAPNMIVWIKHLAFEWQIFDSYELFILVAIAHICLSRTELNLNNLFILRFVLIGSAIFINFYAILLLYRVLNFTFIISIVFISSHMWSFLKEKSN